MNRESFIKEFEKRIQDMLELIKTKNADYSTK
jgi:hypothetical protein